MIPERREFPRQARSQEVHCYIDGVRVDARTMDMSASGAFVRMSQSRAVSMGSLVGLVFLRHPRMLQTTFMFGRVVRTQAAPVEGIALAWEKAVTVAPAEDLARFLETVFGIMSPEIRRETAGPRGTPRNVFAFGSISVRPDSMIQGVADNSGVSPAASTGFEPEPVDLAPVRKPAQRPGSKAASVEIPDPFDAVTLCAGNLAVTSEDFDAMDLKVIALESDGTVIQEPVAREGRHRRRESGQISAMVARDDVNLSLSGVITLGGAALPVVIRQLAEDHVFVNTAFVPMNRDAGLNLRFEIPARRGSVTVECVCRLQDVCVEDSAPGSGLLLRVVSMNEGNSPGIVMRYVKFVQFSDLARA